MSGRPRSAWTAAAMTLASSEIRLGPRPARAPGTSYGSRAASVPARSRPMCRPTAARKPSRAPGGRPDGPTSPECCKPHRQPRARRYIVPAPEAGPLERAGSASVTLGQGRARPRLRPRGRPWLQRSGQQSRASSPVPAPTGQLRRIIFQDGRGADQITGEPGPLGDPIWTTAHQLTRLRGGDRPWTEPADASAVHDRLSARSVSGLEIPAYTRA